MKFLSLCICAAFLALGGSQAKADDMADCQSKTLPASRVIEACTRAKERMDQEMSIMNSYVQCTMFSWGIPAYSRNIFASCDSLLKVEFVDPHTRATYYKSRGDAFTDAGDARRAQEDYDTADRLDASR